MSKKRYNVSTEKLQRRSAHVDRNCRLDSDSSTKEIDYLPRELFQIPYVLHPTSGSVESVHILRVSWNDKVLEGTRGACATERCFDGEVDGDREEVRDDASARVHKTMRPVISVDSRRVEHNGRCIGMRDTRLPRQLCFGAFCRRAGTAGHLREAESLDPCFCRGVPATAAKSSRGQGSENAWRTDALKGRIYLDCSPAKRPLPRRDLSIFTGLCRLFGARRWSGGSIIRSAWETSTMRTRCTGAVPR